MTITYLDIYNAVSAQAWSMFDTDAENKEDFETALSTSIQKALSELWCSYEFPFRIKKMAVIPNAGKYKISSPDGNILKKVVNGKEVYSIRIGNKFLEYDDSYIEGVSDKRGEPERFYSDGEYIYLDPIPDKAYQIIMEYTTLQVGFNEAGDSIYTLNEDNDYLDIPEKYETLFKNALITKSMVYVIASPSDENYPGYYEQYENAYKILIDYCRGLEIKKRYFW